MKEISRWEKWYSEDNLAKDSRIVNAPPSHCAKKAVRAFMADSKNFILDLGCGIGRDTAYLAANNLSTIGLDVSISGLRVAQGLNTDREEICGWVRADACYLPFKNMAFDGVYSFGLLHEFTTKDWKENVDRVLEETIRLLLLGGLLVIAVLSGSPGTGLPDVQFFNREMLEEIGRKLQILDLEEFFDIGCTGRSDYRVWYGVMKK